MANELTLPFGADLPKRPLTITYHHHKIPVDEKGFFDLTAMWKAAGSPKDKDFPQWKRGKKGASFIKDLASALNMEISHVLRSTTGRSGGTWAHWQIGLAYAKYLSNEFHRVVNQAFKEWSEEKADPGLKMDRGVKAARARGWPEAKIEARFKGIDVRKEYCATLSDHNCSEAIYPVATNAINLAILQQTAREFRAARGLSKSARTRDEMDDIILDCLRIAEKAATVNIKVKAADGDEQCLACTREAAVAVKPAVDNLKALFGTNGCQATA
jgi:hypothetical protein